MEWVRRLNEAVKYVEAHLAEEVDPEEAARAACCSSFHFQRMFAYLAGVPLGEYVRRRRMTLAAGDIQSGEKIIDVAFKYGYQSPTAFNRAFQSVHGVAPSEARREGVRLRAYPPISFQIMVKGAAEMEYQMMKRDAFRIVGLAAPMARSIEENFREVPKLWEKAAKTNAIPTLAELMEGEPMGILGVSVCFGEAWRYYIAAATEKPAPEGMEAYTVPACTWAVFEGSGPMPAAIQELEQRAVTEWLPGSGYEYADAPDLEVYLNADPADARFQVWLPVVKKE